VIENVIKNAADAMEGNGNIYLNMEKQQNSIVIKVKDNGKGIPSSIQKTIFQPGYTTKDRGWGLGLSLAKRIVEGHHNGKIYISSSKKGIGTVVEITLPSSK
jgi:signal transduction histidine kinase